jgi:outer membrane receptor for monomeric catechols
MMDDPAILKFIVDGRWLPNSPQHQLALDVRYNLTPGLSIGLGTETLSKAHIDGANIESEAAEGYTLLHGRIRYTWHDAGFGGELSVHVRNIGDKEYVAFTEPDPGGNSYQPGARREIFCGVRIRL